MSITNIMFRALSQVCVKIFALLAAVHYGHAQALTNCQAAPGDHYEAVFCELSSSRYKYSLPSLQEFRQNPARVQYLLIKRAANREGITLNKPGKFELVSKSPKVVVAKSPGTSQAPPVEPLNDIVVPSGKGRCNFAIRSIRCGDKQYVLQTNRRNSELGPDALSDSNSLRLPARRSRESAEAWLARAYTEYLMALLSIGLAGSSSSYSAFAHTYFELEGSSTDFATRIQQSFALLKKDKRTLAVSKRYPKAAPVATDCESLTSTMIACNSAGKNWVYISD